MQMITKSRRLLGFVLLGLFLLSCATTFNEVVVINAASEGIKTMRISIADENTALPRLDRGAKWDGRIRISHDSGIRLIVEFESGRRLEKEGGYVTNHLNVVHVLTVKDTDIEFAAR